MSFIQNWPVVSRPQPPHTAPLYRAMLLDREADTLLQQGRSAAAERLSHYALELRVQFEGRSE